MLACANDIPRSNTPTCTHMILEIKYSLYHPSIDILKHLRNLVWPRIYAHSSISSLVQSLLPKDTLLRTYLTSLQLVTGTVWRR